jgi:hypothetical protein
MITELQQMAGVGALKIVPGTADDVASSAAQEFLAVENDSFRLLLEQAGVDAKALLAQAGIDAR